jgi:hypothetical protein
MRLPHPGGTNGLSGHSWSVLVFFLAFLPPPCDVETEKEGSKIPESPSSYPLIMS